MTDATDTIWEGIQHSFLMAYEVWWALVLGFAISAVVQAWVPRERVQSALAGSGCRPLARATGLGASSSSSLLLRHRSGLRDEGGPHQGAPAATRRPHLLLLLGALLPRFEADPDAYTGVGATPAPAHAGHAH